MKRAVKVIFPMVFLIALMAGTTLTANALTVAHTYTIDNDDAQGFRNDRYGFDTLFQANNLYYQDARRQVCNSNDNDYSYIFPGYTRYTTIYGEISAYLYDVSFTDPLACYQMNDYSMISFCIAGYINQDLAAPGWNKVGNASTTSAATGLNATQAVRVTSGKGYPTKYCGADAIKIVLSY